MTVRFWVRTFVIVLCIVLAIAFARHRPEFAAMFALGIVLWFVEIFALSFIPIR
jgi:hypothetical protein